MGKGLPSRYHSVIIGLLIICVAAGLWIALSRKPETRTHVPPPPTIAPKMVNPWRAAARKVEEDRGEPTGRKAQVTVPDELKHYSDRRRFLAVQVAEWREQQYDIPHDFAELINLIRADQLVEMEPLGEDYILYGVGANATADPFTHFDRASGEDIALFADLNEFQKEDSRLAESLKQAQAKTAELQREYARTGKRERKRRSEIQSRINESRKQAKSIADKQKLLASFYKNAKNRDLVLGEYRALSELAADFSGKAYDLAKAEDRKQMKVRLLSFIRPEAKEAILEIARSYNDKFDRRLPITSLVRTERYQLHLGETNPNATRIAVPPHTTGLAFDIYYRYMTAEEQDYVMAEIAKLKASGKLEALRETRDHIHVFAFADGERPDESIIAQAMNQLGAGRSVRQPEPKRAKAASKRSAKSAARSKSSRSARVAKGRAKSRRPVARADSSGR